VGWLGAINKFAFELESCQGKDLVMREKRLSVAKPLGVKNFCIGILYHHGNLNASRPAMSKKASLKIYMDDLSEKQNILNESLVALIDKCEQDHITRDIANSTVIFAKKKNTRM
jgi:hypothetical protein